MGEHEQQVLEDHQVGSRILDLINEAEETLFLVTAYMSRWPHLDRAVERALRRGVDTTLVTRVPDGRKTEAKRAQAFIDEFRKLGVRVVEVKRLHAKVYWSEREVILTSMNLVGASRDSIEIGLATTDPGLRQQALTAIQNLHPDVAAADPAPEPTTHEPGHGVCIGCGDTDHPFDMARPLCMTCYRGSKRGTDPTRWTDRRCHSCGTEHAATVEKPVCLPCYRALNSRHRRKRKSS